MDRLRKNIENLSEKELAWALLHFAKADDPLVFDIAKATVERRIVPQFQEVFLKILLSANRSTMERVQKIALARGARGEVGIADIRALGRWYDINAESALLSICAIAQDDNIALAAFDTLGARSLSSEPARTLIEWIRASYFET